MATAEERLNNYFDNPPPQNNSGRPGAGGRQLRDIVMNIERLDSTANFTNLLAKAIESENSLFYSGILDRAEEVGSGIDSAIIKNYIDTASSKGIKQNLSRFLKNREKNRLIMNIQKMYNNDNDNDNIVLGASICTKPASNLPPGWIAKVSRTTGMPYYVKDGVAQVNKPTAGGKYRTKRRKHKAKKTRRNRK